MGKELEPTIWILGEHNEHLPALQFTPESTLSIVSYYFIYCVLWLIMTYRYADMKHKKESFMGFLFGLIILMVLDYINNFSTQLVVDKNTGAFTYLNTESVYIAENNKYYTFNENDSILMTKDRADDLIKNNQIKAIPILEYVNNQYAKLGSTRLGSPAATVQDQNIKLLGASYMIISLLTLGMISSDISESLSKNIMPYVTAATLFSVAMLAIWVYTPAVEDMIKIGVFKLKSLVIAISFSMTACLIFLNDTK